MFFSRTESNFVLRDKLSPGTKPGFLKSEKMLKFMILYTHQGVITSTTKHPPPYSGYSICLLAITSANTNTHKWL